MLRGYTLDTLRHDVLAGLSVATVAVPQAMAYAMIAGLPVEYGLYTAIVMTAVGALLDTSRQLINGPTNAISIALLSAVGLYADIDSRVEAAIALTFLIGAFQVLVALARLGDLTRYISHSVIVGFTAGASVLLVLDQAKNLLGQQATGDAHDHFLVRFARTHLEGGPVHGPTLAVGVASIALVVGLRALKRWRGWTLLPELLVVVALMAALSSALDLQALGVAVVGPIPAALPTPRVPHLSWDLVRGLSTSALAIGLLGLLEALAMAKAITAASRVRMDLNQQVLSEGVANLAGSFFQSIPGSGSLTRSAINVQAGGRTQWSAIVSAVAVAAITLVFAPYAQFIPRSALAGILILTAGKMIHLGDLRFHLRASRFDAIIVLATAISAFAISIEFCVLIGVFLSFMLAVPRIGQMRLTEFVVTAEGGIHERLQTDETCGHVRIYSLEGEMFFGAAESLAHHLEAIEEAVEGGTRVVLLRVKRARSPDAVGMAQLQAFLERLAARGVHVALTGVRPDFLATLEGSGLRARLAEDQLYLDLPVRKTATARAVEQLIDKVQEPCPRCPREVRERIRDRVEV